MKDNKKVIYWLLIGCFLIFTMVVIGGITRLTHSGLSMSDYKLIKGTLPPMNEVQWEEAFELYKQYPEFQKLNYNFTLQDFKQIYFWEWLHRVLGRLVGLVFIIPFVYFLIRKQLSNSTIKKALILLGLGGFQGFLGWYMVKSGLVDRPDVSHYRLAAHLSTAFITFAYTFWVALDLIFPNKKQVSKGYRNLLRFGLVLLLLQIVYGAFVAGLKAGLIVNTWPMMGNSFISPLVSELLSTEGMIALLDQPVVVQFVHRWIPLLIAIPIIILILKNERGSYIWKLAAPTHDEFNILELCEFTADTPFVEPPWFSPPRPTSVIFVNVNPHTFLPLCY